MAGFGPMLGQNHHFNLYAPEKIPYAIKRYVDETHRLYGVLDRQLRGKDYITGDYSIADIACIGWANGYVRQGIDIAEFPDFAAWHQRMNARPAVKRALAIVTPPAQETDATKDKQAQAILFGQR
jgi:GST-like protein